MIASFSRGFVFIKTRKTAGTSIEIALSWFCAAGDIITPIAPVDEIVRRQQGGRPPQNYCEDRAAEAAFRESLGSGDLAAIKKAGRIARQTRQFRNHMRAGAVAQQLPDQFWRDAFTFTIDRHPYEKAVSLAHYGYGNSARNRAGQSFEAFLDRVVERGKYRNFDLYAADGVPLVDAVLKYEEMPDCFGPLRERTGIDIASILPKTKHMFRTDRRPAADVLSERQKETIATLCRPEFELSNYAR